MSSVLAGQTAIDRFAYLVSAGERIRHDGGLLLYDCKAAFGEELTWEAEARGLLVTGCRFRRLDTCKLTPGGRRLASRVAQRIADSVRTAAALACSGVPWRALALLVREIIVDPRSYRARLKPALTQDLEVGGYFSLSCESESKSIRHYCLLTFAEYRKMVFDLLETMIQADLGMEVSSYVGTDNGTIRDPAFCLTRDAERGLREVVRAHGVASRIPPDLERLHGLYHSLWGPIHKVGENRIQVTDQDDPARLSLLQQILERNLARPDDSGLYLITDSPGYQRFVADRCLGPVLKYLLES